MSDAIERFERMDWSRASLRRHAEGFSVDLFQSKMRAFLAHIGARIEDAGVLSNRASTKAAALVASRKKGLDVAGQGIPA
jgi:hypothetical protein